MYTLIAGGEVPPWLMGSLYRVGPGVIQSGDTYYDHLFDMPSVLHKYTINPEKGVFTYQNRIVTLMDSESLQQPGSPKQEQAFGTKVRR